jgi:Catalase
LFQFQKRFLILTKLDNAIASGTYRQSLMVKWVQPDQAVVAAHRVSGGIDAGEPKPDREMGNLCSIAALGSLARKDFGGRKHRRVNAMGVFMQFSQPNAPVPYDASLEAAEPSEAATGSAMVETLRGISETTFNNSGRASRSVHAKSHGVFKATLHVAPELPPVLAQGLFSEPKSYTVTIRFSTIPGDVLDDKVSTPRGMAIKVRAENGQRMPNSSGDGSQDFLMVNGPAFGAANAKGFLKSLKLLAATTDKAPQLKQAASAVLRSAERAIEALGGKSARIISLGGHPLSNILGETFFAQVPILYGPYIAKFCCVPISADLVALKNAAVDMADNPDALRDAVKRHFCKNNSAWELRVQLCTDIETMPIEDSSVVWPVSASPYITVARIVAPIQTVGELEAGASDDTLSFSPWNALDAHRPLGSINRVRKAAYEMSAGFRRDHVRCPVQHIKERDDGARRNAAAGR